MDASSTISNQLCGLNDNKRNLPRYYHFNHSHTLCLQTQNEIRAVVSLYLAPSANTCWLHHLHYFRWWLLISQCGKLIEFGCRNSTTMLIHHRVWQLKHVKDAMSCRFHVVETWYKHLRRETMEQFPGSKTCQVDDPRKTSVMDVSRCVPKFT